MIKHILKIVWNERKINLLLVVEYFLIFCILWFVCEELYTVFKQNIESTGMNIEHTYRINMRRTDAPDGQPIKYSKEKQYDFTSTLYDRLKRYPGVESVGLSVMATPYVTYANGWYYCDEVDSLYFNMREGRANLGYFEVFKIPVTGNLSGWDEVAANKRVIVVSSPQGTIGSKSKIPVGSVRNILKQRNKGKDPEPYEVKGYTPPIKFNEMFPVLPFRYEPLQYRDFRLDEITDEISIRVRPEADKDFVERFTRDMSEQLKIGDYYLASVVPYKDVRKNFLQMVGATEAVNTRLSVIGFLVLNIFLGILGSFWFRTQARRSEIGLRIAIGSSKAKVKWMMVAEALLLLATASITATVVCFFLQSTQLPQLTGSVTAQLARHFPDAAIRGFMQNIINFGLACGLLTLITYVAVWYPAKQAADTQPAETLHED